MRMASLFAILYIIIFVYFVNIQWGQIRQTNSYYLNSYETHREWAEYSNKIVSKNNNNYNNHVKPWIYKLNSSLRKHNNFNILNNN